MPRAKTIYTEEFPYHITARANNKDFFPLPLKDLWEIFSESLSIANRNYNFRIHSFVLMSNHYHLIASCNKEYLLSFIMNWLQTRISKAINFKTDRVNHIFGNRHKASIISNNIYYSHAVRYVFQNPVRAGICEDVDSYAFSTITAFKEAIRRGISNMGWQYQAPNNLQYLPLHDLNPKILNFWLNKKYSDEDILYLKKSLKRTVFRPIKKRGTRKNYWLYESLIEPKLIVKN